MLGALLFTIGYIIAKKLDDAGDYKPPVGKHKNRYK
jgi:hypothetical protein